MKKWLFLLLLFPLTCIAQTYQYLGVEDELVIYRSGRNVVGNREERQDFPI